MLHPAAAWVYHAHRAKWLVSLVNVDRGETGNMILTPRKRGKSVRADLVRTDPKQADERRKALKAIGKFGLYTAPTLLALLESGRAHASGPPL